jgi:hypothetical protein
MKRLLLLALLAACASERSTVDPVSHSADASDSAIAARLSVGARRLEADVRWLSDDARAGRRAGEPGALEAADWLARQCAEIGLEPAGSNQWFQDFEVELEPKDGGESRLDIAFEGAPLAWSGADDVQPLACGEAGVVEAPLEWLGFGIEDPAQGWDDYAGRDVAGKIAVIVRGTPPEPAPREGEAAPKADAKSDAKIASDASRWLGGGTIFHKVVTARRRGAVGVVVVSRGTGEAPFAFDAGGGGGKARLPAIALSRRAGDRLVGGDLEGALRVPAGGVKLDIGARARLVCDIDGGKALARNVLARQPGVDRSRTIVVGAHYDHLGWGGSGSLHGGARAIHNGADDNASGSAAVLELARVFGSSLEAPPCDILYAWWTAEELGLLGSEHWAQQPTTPLAGIVAYLNYDMVGRAKDGNLQVLAAGSAAEFPPLLERAAAQAELKLSQNASGSSFGGSSDHATFLKREVPALHFFTGLHEDYHKPSDDHEKFEAEGCAKVVLMSEVVVRAIGAAPKLAYVAPKLDDKGRREVRSGFSSWFGSMPNYAWDREGVLLDGTSSGSPAEKAGLLKGDVLVKMDEVEVKDIYDFMWVLQTKKPGDLVQVGYLRDGQLERVAVTLGSRGAR